MIGSLHKTGLTLLALLVISGCTFIHPENPSLPSKADITPGEMVTVKGNENIYAIAREHGVSMRETIVLNNLQPPYVLKPGQQLILPAKAGEAASSFAPPPDPAPSGMIDRAPLAPIEPVPLSAQTVPPANPAGTSSYFGVKPAGAPLPPIAPPAAPPSAPAAGLSPVQNFNTPLPPPKPMVTTVAAAPAAMAVSAASAPATPAPAADSNLIWPVQGPVLSGFGPKGQGLNNDGVNIGAPKGAPVVAAASGIVVYAGNEMKGFGNLILIRHQGGLVTAYAHLDRTLVSKDAVVAQGDMIGTVGKTGDVPSPQLHFEVRQNGKPVDPNGLIKG